MTKYPRLKKRFQWLEVIIRARRYSIGAEIGCANGNTTARILNNCPGLKKLYAVDLWARVPDGEV